VVDALSPLHDPRRQLLLLRQPRGDPELLGRLLRQRRRERGRRRREHRHYLLLLPLQPPLLRLQLAQRHPALLRRLPFGPSRRPPHGRGLHPPHHSRPGRLRLRPHPLARDRDPVVCHVDGAHHLRLRRREPLGRPVCHDCAVVRRAGARLWPGGQPRHCAHRQRHQRRHLRPARDPLPRLLGAVGGPRRLRPLHHHGPVELLPRRADRGQAARQPRLQARPARGTPLLPPLRALLAPRVRRERRGARPARGGRGRRGGRPRCRRHRRAAQGGDPHHGGARLPARLLGPLPLLRHRLHRRPPLQRHRVRLHRAEVARGRQAPEPGARRPEECNLCDSK
jgi:hypothetical protein